jgi:hypothetical protein
VDEELPVADATPVQCDELIKGLTPEFQRSNDQWTQDMKILYVENVIKGCRSEILLYRVPNEHSPAMILDGLQRLTAIMDFIAGRFTVFGKYTLNDLLEARVITAIGTDIPVKIYTFDTELEAMEFYIEMNENITHSPEDIEKVRKLINQNGK